MQYEEPWTDNTDEWASLRLRTRQLEANAIYQLNIRHRLLLANERSSSYDPADRTDSKMYVSRRLSLMQLIEKDCIAFFARSDLFPNRCEYSLISHVRQPHLSSMNLKSSNQHCISVDNFHRAKTRWSLTARRRKVLERNGLELYPFNTILSLTPRL